MWSCDLQKQALLPHPLTMAAGNLVNLEKTSEISPIQDEFLASNKTKLLIVLAENWKKSAFKFSIEGPVLLVFVNLCQIFLEGLLVITINKSQSFS